METNNCPKCGGEIKIGEAFIKFTFTAGSMTSGLSSMGMPGLDTMGGSETVDEGVKWREKTGRQKGWLLKREEEKTMRLYGKRCTICGYIEFYAYEK